MNNTDNAARTGEVAHTPTPYRQLGELVLGSFDGQTNHVATCALRAGDSREANAAFIVRACNSHAALVDALEAFAALDISPSENQKHADMRPIFGLNSTLITVGDVRKARAALALAKGGQQ